MFMIHSFGVVFGELTLPPRRPTTASRCCEDAWKNFEAVRISPATVPAASDASRLVLEALARARSLYGRRCLWEYSLTFGCPELLV